MIFSVDSISCGYHNKAVVENISFEIGSGMVFCLLGPNGIGKTTLFKSVLGSLKLLGGKIMVDGEDIAEWPIKKIAKVIGYVPQSHIPSFPFTVIDVVAMGRIAHLGVCASPGAKDIRLAEESLDQLGISHLRDRIYTQISGGERQMVLIARALTQEPSMIFMDEPTSNLDFGNQVRVLEVINRLAGLGKAIVMTSHFPDHAFLCSSTVGLLQRNSELKVGKAEEIITEDNLLSAYGVDVKIIKKSDEINGNLISCVPIVQ